MAAHQVGRLAVVAGCMFSGKTEELIRRARRSHIAKRRVRMFKHAKDDRYDAERVVSHDNGVYDARPVQTLQEVRTWADGGQGDWGFIGIDEFQFFDDEPEVVVDTLAYLSERTKVVVAGLDLDSDGRPFGPMPLALAMADVVVKLTAVCVKCGRDATRSYRNPEKHSGETEQVGAAGLYEARCIDCWRKP